MSSQQKNLIQSAADNLRRDHPKLFGILSAVLHARNLSEARRACNYPSPEDFTSDYHKAIEHLAKELRDQGYIPPSETDTFENRMGQTSADAPLSHFKLPSREIINRCYKGHIFHEACVLVAKQNHQGLAKLWTHFPSQRHEIEIASTLTPRPGPRNRNPSACPMSPFDAHSNAFCPHWLARLHSASSCYWHSVHPKAGGHSKPLSQILKKCSSARKASLT